MNKMPHIQLDSSINCSCAILPGDPARVDAIAAYLEDVHEEAFNREYKSITGTYKGTRILAISTGMGGPSAAICVEELACIGIKHIVRIGSCGALQSGHPLGELVLCDRAVCDDGTSRTYLQAEKFIRQLEENLPCEEPQISYAYADEKLQNACRMAAEQLQIPYAIGSTRCHDALYQRTKPALDEFYSGKGIYASDMETAALFAVSTLRGLRTASILNVVVEWKKDLKDGISSYKNGEDAAALGERNEILLALETLAAVSLSPAR